MTRHKGPVPVAAGRADLAVTLRRMVAVLQAERHALAGLDLEAILGAAIDKRDLCEAIAPVDADPAAIDGECRGLLDAARRLNEANRQVRNLIAANVGARLDALTGTQPLYNPRAGYAVAAGR